MHDPRHAVSVVLMLAFAGIVPNVQGQTTSPTTLAGGGTGVNHFVSSNSGSNAFNGVNINDRIGATTLYTAGFTGTRSIVANIEAGHVWSGHETLTHVNTFLNGVDTVAANSGNNAAVDRHATWVGATIAGRTSGAFAGEYQRGIADGATLWSGSIASSWTGSPYSLGFSFNQYESFFRPYRTAMLTGVSGQTADVVNSSWGTSNDSAGNSIFSRGIDSLIAQTGKIVTVSAGNSGPNANTVGGPATAYNTISVAALGSDTDTITYNTVSSFSSRGPNDVFIPTNAASTAGNTFSNARVKVDIAAPGQNLTLAFYGGTTGGNTGGTAQNGNDLYSGNVAGTSFAAPTVAGSIALLVDVAKANSLTHGTDTRIIKTILQTTADKTAGWSNAQSLNLGVITTTQALDVNVGAGRVNLTRALPLLDSASSTRDVAGTNAGNQGTVATSGWDFGSVNRFGQNDYTVNTNLQTGSTITVTLNWLARRSISGEDFTTLQDNGLSNLDLEVWLLSGGTFTTKIASSEALYNNTEHLSFQTTQDGTYGIRVNYVGDSYRFDGNSSDLYGIAWNFVPVPEPATIGGIATGMVLVVSAVQRRRIRNRRATTTDSRPDIG